MLQDSSLFSLLGNEKIIFAAILSALITLILKCAPIMFLKSSSMSIAARRWLDFIPVAVMGALVGPDIFIYEGNFNISFDNLFLMVSIPTFLIAVFSKNYFVTIAFGIILVIIGRYFGLS